MFAQPPKSRGARALFCWKLPFFSLFFHFSSAPLPPLTFPFSLLWTLFFSYPSILIFFFLLFLFSTFHYSFLEIVVCFWFLLIYIRLFPMWSHGKHYFLFCCVERTQLTKLQIQSLTPSSRDEKDLFKDVSHILSFFFFNTWRSLLKVNIQALEWSPLNQKANWSRWEWTLV